MGAIVITREAWIKFRAKKYVIKHFQVHKLESVIYLVTTIYLLPIRKVSETSIRTSIITHHVMACEHTGICIVQK